MHLKRCVTLRAIRIGAALLASLVWSSCGDPSAPAPDDVRAFVRTEGLPDVRGIEMLLYLGDRDLLFFEASYGPSRSQPRGGSQSVAPSSCRPQPCYLLVHVSCEHGHGWTTVAIDRTSREWALAPRRRQLDAARVAVDVPYR